MKQLLFSLLTLLSFQGITQQVTLVTPLQDSLIETSGLLLIENKLITHNDSGGEKALYEIDTVSGGIARKVIIENAPNVDWEDVCHDDTYIYIADFGNNSGNRTNLRVYRVLISDYLNTPNDSISADTIFFDYADQTDFTATSFSTNYDAEAIISWNDSLYIFTKNWGNMWTNIYALPKTPGNYSLPKIDSINAEGLITGASFNASSNSIMLSGYAFTYPFVIEISGFTNSQFSSATVDRTQIQLPSGYSYQLEGITPISANNYYISTEESFSGASGLFRLEMDNTSALPHLNDTKYSIYPNPASDKITITCQEGIEIELYSLDGRRLLSTLAHEIDVSNLSKSTYVVILRTESGEIVGQQKVFID